MSGNEPLQKRFTNATSGVQSVGSPPLHFVGMAAGEGAAAGAGAALADGATAASSPDAGSATVAGREGDDPHAALRSAITASRRDEAGAEVELTRAGYTAPT